MNKDAILEAIRKRHSCREFDGKKIPGEDFEIILEGARMAPSSLGLEPWEFVIVTSKDVKEKIASEARGNETIIRSCSHLAVVFALGSERIRPESSYVKNHYGDRYETMSAMLDSVRKNRLKGNDVLIDSYAREQCFIAVGQMTLVAAALGVDSCIIGGFYAKGVKTLLNDCLQTDCLLPVCLIAFGYGTKSPSPKRRKPYEESVKFIR